MTKCSQVQSVQSDGILCYAWRMVREDGVHLLLGINFDSVPHWQLIAKLQTSGLNIYVLKSYTGRMQIVVLKCGLFAAISSIVRSPPSICPGAPFFIVWLHVMQVFQMDPR